MRAYGFVKEGKDQYYAYRKLTTNDIVSMYKTIIKNKYRRGKALSKPQDAIELFQSILLDQDREVFIVLYLDNRHRVIEVVEEFHGTIDQSAVYPRVIAEHALKRSAAACIVGHNHPSGCGDPSESDRAITRRLKTALSCLDIRLLDHFVIGAENVTSLAERGMM